MSPSSSDKTDSKQILRRSLEMLERSQLNLEGSLANLERSLAIENTLSRLVEAQEKLRQMVMVLITRTDVPAASPIPVEGLPTRDPTPSMKHEQEEEEEDQIERTELPATSDSRLVVRDEEEEEISSVSSVSSEDLDDLDDEGIIATESTSANVPEEDEQVRPGYQTRGQLAAKEPRTMDPMRNEEEEEARSSKNEVIEESDDDEDDSSLGSEHRDNEEITSGEEDYETSDTESPMPRSSQERLSTWKCAACGKVIRGHWTHRQHHIHSHEGLKLSCPVCAVRINHTSLRRHLHVMHGTSRGSLPARTNVQLQRQQDKHNQLALECERKYFPPSSLVSSEETLRRREAEFTCRKCGKFCVDPSFRRDHVGLHLNLKILCPIRECKGFMRARSMVAHLYNMHGKTLAKLTKGERERFEESRKTFYEEVDAVMEEYFQEARRTEDKSLSCKKCGRRVMDRHQRRDHVGIHLKARFPCPYRKCGYSGREATMA
uniref:C2H2-type domain-containing protein n=1 Tax=Steinernema glaseri TaxID=37863 RepID=A0A1I8AGF9_9BILA